MARNFNLLREWRNVNIKQEWKNSYCYFLRRKNYLRHLRSSRRIHVLDGAVWEKRKVLVRFYNL